MGDNIVVTPWATYIQCKLQQVMTIATCTGVFPSSTSAGTPLALMVVITHCKFALVVFSIGALYSAVTNVHTNE